MTAVIAASSEPIPGYIVRDRLGAGGYGEVWTAEAPGGLIKAIKFVFGFLDDERATRELKALNRVKEVRHPFLLSLERIEIADGQLVIVTELAEMSLRDLFHQHRDEGRPGIPRDELLDLMRDTADALDYMSSRHQLQHLDIKPENLLLVGGRIKVADFGLVKDIREQSQSLMGGLTPHYAPPEVFDGRPSLCSDQYSLAIVYQEMLTGVRPFPGRTPAQLAAQHLQGKPQLGVLPAVDQPVIARALEKRPLDRFPNCRALVDSLLAAGRTAANVDFVSQSEPSGTALTAPPSIQPQSLPIKATERMGAEAPRQEAAPEPAPRPAVVAAGMPELPEAAPVRKLPPLSITAREAAVRPTLFVGVGGTGAAALSRLRRHLQDRFGDVRRLPCVRMLALDTDARSLAQLTSAGEPALAFSAEETLMLPLRSSHDYRGKSQKLLQWMSRRWLYNIPRSLQTEGLRPLGRLALVDHADEVFDALRQALRRALDPAGIEQTKSALGASDTHPAPRVVIISSICGGASSGMTLDLAQFVRQAMADLECAGEVCGLLTHSTSRQGGLAKELALANAAAFLGEWRHYESAGGRPGDAACGLAPGKEGVPLFDLAHLVHLGDDQVEEDFDRGMEDLAAHLALRCFSPAAEFYEAVHSGQTPVNSPVLRTFGFLQLGGPQEALVNAASDAVCRLVVRRWVGREAKAAARRASLALALQEGESAPAAAAPVDNMVDVWVSQQTCEAGLDEQGLCREIAALADRICDGSVEAAVHRLIENAARKKRGVWETAQAIKMLLIGRTAEDEDVSNWNEESVALLDELMAAVGSLAQQRAEALIKAIISLMDSQSAMVERALRARELFDRRLQTIEKIGRDLSHRFELEAQECERQLRAAVAASRKGGVHDIALQPRVLELSKLTIQSVVHQGLCQFALSARRRLGVAGDLIKELKRDLEKTIDLFAAGDDSAAASSVAGLLQSKAPELAAQLDKRLRETFFQSQGGIRAVFDKKLNVRAALPGALREASRAAVLETLKEIDLAAALLSPSGESSTHLGDNLQGGAPRLLRCGGDLRLLLALPQGSDGEALHEEVRRQLDHDPTVVFHNGSEAALCYELENVPLDHVAALLVEHRPDCFEAATRLHTRCDIEWSAW